MKPPQSGQVRLNLPSRRDLGIILLFYVFFFHFIFPAFGDTVSVRDLTGKLIRTEKKGGNTTVVEDLQGKLIEKRVRRDIVSRLEIRMDGTQD